jgi:hypothetical protein
MACDMKNIVLAVVLSLALAGCASTKKAENKPPREVKPIENLLTVKDMTDCEQQLGVTPPKTPGDVYGMSEESINKIKDCAYEREKERMPLLADLIDKYKLMLRQGNQECAKDIGTNYAASCMKNSVNDAAGWYNLAVAQRLQSELPNQPPAPAAKP